MNPYFSIWFNTRNTIDEKLKSNWMDNHGVIPYLLFGINGSLTRGNDLLFLGLSPIINFFIIVAFGVTSGLITRVIGVYILFFFGKIWNGKASKNEIDTVLSLSLIPELLVTVYLLTIISLQGGVLNVIENNIITFVVYFFCLRILLIGISRVQKISYGLSLLTILLPQLIVAFLYLILRGGN